MLLVVHATVISATGVVLKTLIDVLQRAGARKISVFANAIGDSFVFDPRPDFVVGVLSPTARDPQQGLTNLDVMLRIGRSVEQHIPTLLIVPPPLLAVSPMPGVAIAYCPTDHEEALTLHVSAIVATSTPQDGEVHEQAQTPTKSGVADRIEQLTNRPNLSAVEFETLLIEILTSDPGSRAAVVSKVMAADKMGVDFVVSPTEAPSSVVLVQAKMGHQTPQSILRSEEELRTYVTNSKASLGLLVVYDPEAPEIPIHTAPIAPFVISVSLKNLAERLLTQNLLRVLVNATAEAVGGEVS